LEQRDRQLEQWVEMARRGDTEALDALGAHVRPILARYVDRKMGVRARRWCDPEDVVQRALAEVLPRVGELPGPFPADELLRRLYRVAEWRLLDAVRSHRREAGESASPEVARDPAESAPSRGEVTRADDRRWLARIVDGLPPKYSEVVRRVALEGLDYGTVAEQLGLRHDAVRRRYERAVERLIDKAASRRRDDG